MAAVFTVSMGYAVVLPPVRSLLLRVGAEATPVSVSQHTAFLAGTYMLAFAVFSPVWGKAADTWGRRAVVLVSMAGFTGTSAALAFTTKIGAFYGLRGLSGAFAAGVLPAALAHVSDTSDGANRAGRVGRITAAATLGFLAGPSLSGWIAGLGRLASGAPQMAQVVAVPLLVIALLAFVVFAACQVFLKESLRDAQSRESAIASPPDSAEASLGQDMTYFAKLLALTVLGTFALGGLEVGAALRGQQVLGFGPRQIALVFVGCGLVMLVTQAALVGPALARAGACRIAALALIVAAAGFVLLVVVMQRVGFVLAGGMVAAGAGLLVPLAAYLASSRAGDLKGTVLGWQSAAAGLGQALGSTIFGLLYGLSANAPFWLTAGLLMSGLALRPADWSLGEQGSRVAGNPTKTVETKGR